MTTTEFMARQIHDDVQERLQQQCKEFKRIKDSNGGKVPRDYKGAYEKHMEKSGKVVAAVAAKTEPDDHEGTFLWPLI